MKKINRTNLADVGTLVSLAAMLITFWVVIVCAIVGNTGVLPWACTIAYLIFSATLFGRFIGFEAKGIIRILAGTLCMGIALVLPYVVILNIFH